MADFRLTILCQFGRNFPVLFNRQIDMEHGAFAGRALHINKAVMGLHCAKGHGKSEACALAGFLGGKEGFKQMFDCMLRYAVRIPVERDT